MTDSHKGNLSVIVIGASVGAIEALSVILPGLPPGYPFAVLVVVHIPSDRSSLLTEIFAPRCNLAVKEAEDKELLAPATIYFAPPDYHLLVETGRTFALSQDDRLHFSRPAVDVLFESAAEAYGDRLMGVILSGANSDGAQGLRAVADAGGMAVVQALESAEMIAMPAAALEAVPDSIEVNVSALADLLRKHGVLNDR